MSKRRNLFSFTYEMTQCARKTTRRPGEAEPSRADGAVGQGSLLPRHRFILLDAAGFQRFSAPAPVSGWGYGKGT